MGDSSQVPRTKPPFARGYKLLSGAGLLLLSCGTADHLQIPPEDAGESAADVKSAVNVCPVFGGSLVMPQRIPPDASSSIVVRVTDPDAPDSQLVFSWSAPSGSFSESDNPMTNYRCGQVGPVELMVTATDRVGCVSNLRIDVDCVAN